MNELSHGLYDRHLGCCSAIGSLQLTHVGRRSWRRYRTVLEVVEYDRSVPEFVVVSGFGRRSDWLRNLDVGGRATVAVDPAPPLPAIAS